MTGSYKEYLNKPIVLAIGDSFGKGGLILGLFISSLLLSKDDFASISFSYSIVASSWFLLDLGVNIKATRHLVKGDRQRYASFASIRTISFILCLFGIVLFGIFQKYILMFFLLALSFRLLSFDWLLRARLDYYAAAVSILLSCTLFFAILIFSYVVDLYDAVIVSIAYMFMYCAYFLLTRIFVNDFYIYKPSLKIIKIHIASSISFSVSGFIVSLFVHLPIILLGIIGYNSDSIAKLGFAVLLVSSALFLISIYVIVMLPLVARNAKNENFNKTLIKSGVIFAVIFFILFIVSGKFTQYSYTIVESFLMALFILIYSVRRVFDSKILIKNGEGLYLGASIITLLVLTLTFLISIFYLNYLAVTAYGISIAFSEILFVLLLTNAYRKKI